MFDRADAKLFTRSEAQSYVGRIVKLNSGATVEIVNVFPEARNSYSLITREGYIVYKQHNNCAYVA